jgi:hypothetical protein
VKIQTQWIVMPRKTNKQTNKQTNTLQTVTAELQTVSLVYFFNEKSSYPDFLHVRLARRHSEYG